VATSPGGFSNFSALGLFKSTAIGAISGAVSYGVGSAFASVGSTSAIGSIGLKAGQAVAHGASQTLISGTFGQEINGSTFASAAISSLVGSATANWNDGARILASAAVGGLSSEMTGGNFIGGAARGALISITNHLMHEYTKGVNFRYLKGNGTHFESRQDLMKALVGEADETHGFDYIDKTGEEKYFMLDNTMNNKTTSLWDTKMLPDYVRALRRYHTHPLDGVVSWEDAYSAYNSTSQGKIYPSYVIRKEFIHRVDASRPIPLRGFGIHVSYGEKIARTSDWLNGNFINLE